MFNCYYFFLKDIFKTLRTSYNIAYFDQNFKKTEKKTVKTNFLYNFSIFEAALRLNALKVLQSLRTKVVLDNFCITKDLISDHFLRLKFLHTKILQVQVKIL
jgi:hypothetical protein